MAICQVFYHPDVDEEQWEKLDQDVRATEPVPAEGGRLVVIELAFGAPPTD